MLAIQVDRHPSPSGCRTLGRLHVAPMLGNLAARYGKLSVSPISAEILKRAHKRVESGASIRKTVVKGF
jgi:hypothetical protein